MTFRVEHVRQRSPAQDVLDLFWTDVTDESRQEIFVTTIILPREAAEELTALLTVT